MRVTRQCFLLFFCIQAFVLIIILKKDWHDRFARKGLSKKRSESAENVHVRVSKEKGVNETVRQYTGLTDISRNFPTEDNLKENKSFDVEELRSGNFKVRENYPAIDVQNHRKRKFIRSWCRVQNARTNWQSLLMPCINKTVWGKKYFEDVEETDGDRSYISLWELQPAGSFSRFFIQSVSKANEKKTIGGDSWRVHARGQAVIAPTVFDLGNGVYEVVFLVLEPGRYRVEIYLDYTLCNGLKDPPPYWFKSGNSQGKNQPDGILKGDKPFLIKEFRKGEVISFDIMATESDAFDIADVIETANCSCPYLLWDGLGRWADGVWKPYSTLVRREPFRHDGRPASGTLVVFGDSVAVGFYNTLNTGPEGICNVVFSECKLVYNWVYNMRGYWGDGVTSPREPLPDGNDYDVKRVLDDVRKVLYSPYMNKHSVLILNWGIHFAAVVNFTSYQNLITTFIRIVKHGETDPKTGQFRKFQGKLIWKTTTALNRHRFPNPHKDVRRFLTFPRVLLFNAFATSAMCEAGIDVIDVYPITDAHPEGTMSKDDPVHYGNEVFRDVRRRVFEMFKPRIARR